MAGRGATPRRCPACESDVQTGALECSACGIIFAKWRGPREVERRPEPPRIEPIEKSGGIAGRLVSFVIMVLAIAGGRYGYQLYTEWDAERGALQQVEQLAGQDEQTVRKAASDNLARAGDNAPKAAASQFFGYYFKNTRQYGAYCKNRWQMDVTAFENAFADSHRAEYRQAKSILEAAGMSEEKIWSVTQAALRRAVDIEMSESETRYGMTPIDICRSLGRDPRAAVADMHFSKINREAHTLLMRSPSP